MNGNSPEGPKDYSFYFEGGDVGILLIHGLTGTPVEMRYIGKGLHRAGYTVYGMQLPGHCGSEADLVATDWKDWYAGIERALDELHAKVSKVFVGGLSLGAVLSLRAAVHHSGKIAGLLLYSPTLWYDGWTIPKYSFIWKLLINIPAAQKFKFPEQPPYGIKNERMRERVVGNMLSGNSADAGHAVLTGKSARDMWRLVALVKKELRMVRVPSLILHARDDDISSPSNAHYIAKKSGGPVELHLLDNCYHMITIDQQRDEVLARSIEYLRRFSG